jgi:hypothetical protein
MTTFWKIGIGFFIVGASIGAVWFYNINMGCAEVAPFHVKAKMLFLCAIRGGCW